MVLLLKIYQVFWILVYQFDREVRTLLKTRKPRVTATKLTQKLIASKMKFGAKIFQTIRWRRSTAADKTQAKSLAALRTRYWQQRMRAAALASSTLSSKTASPLASSWWGSSPRSAALSSGTTGAGLRAGMWSQRERGAMRRRGRARPDSKVVAKVFHPTRVIGTKWPSQVSPPNSVPAKPTKAAAH